MGNKNNRAERVVISDKTVSYKPFSSFELEKIPIRERNIDICEKALVNDLWSNYMHVPVYLRNCDYFSNLSQNDKEILKEEWTILSLEQMYEAEDRKEKFGSIKPSAPPLENSVKIKINLEVNHPCTYATFENEIEGR